MQVTQDAPRGPELLLQEQLNSQGLELTAHRLVRWKKDASGHPRNWTTRRKVCNIALVMFLDFFITGVGTVGASPSAFARVEYGVGDTPAIVAFTSMYLLGQAVGGVVFPPYSESFGRKKLYLFSMILFAAFSIIIATVRSIIAVFIGRLVTGFLSSIPGIVVVGSIEDLFDSHTRVWLIFVWLTIANMGLVIGPIFGSYISYTIGWRWVFYTTGIVAGISALLLILTKESRANELLQRRVDSIRKATGDLTLEAQNLDHAPNLGAFVRVALLRPLRLLLTEPIVMIVSIMSALAFGLVYLFTEVLPIVYSAYGFTVEQTSLAFIPLGIGFLCCVFTRLFDRRLAVKRERSNKVLSPEDKISGFVAAAPALAIGLWWFAWTIPPKIQHLHWIVSLLALLPIGFAINEFDCSLVGYLADSYTDYASSAYASLSLLRSIFSAIFPLFARQLFTTLDSNVATSVLAATATIACFSPVILIRYGMQLRQASKFAQATLHASNERDISPAEVTYQLSLVQDK